VARYEDADPACRERRRECDLAIMEPIIRARETYTLPRDMIKASALAYWLSDEREVFVAEDNGEVVGTYCLRANQKAAGRTSPIVAT